MLNMVTVEPASNKHIGCIFMVCVGIDVAKNKYEGFILNSDGEVITDVLPSRIKQKALIHYCKRFAAVPPQQIK